MDTAPGGESTQYESIKTVTEPADKQSGQLGRDLSNTSEDSFSASEKDSGVSEERREQTAEESGMGGKNATSSGNAQQGGYGGTEAQKTDLSNTRREQGYGGGSGVGG